MEEEDNTGLPTKVTLRAATSAIGISCGSDCNDESSLTIPSFIFFEMLSSTVDSIFPSKASTTLQQKNIVPTGFITKHAQRTSKA